MQKKLYVPRVNRRDIMKYSEYANKVHILGATNTYMGYCCSRVLSIFSTLTLNHYAAVNPNLPRKRLVYEKTGILPFLC